VDQYTTLDGQVLDLSALTPTERKFLRRCYEGYLAHMSHADFTNLAERSENPVIAATGGWITAEVHRHPLYQAVCDLEHRLGLQQGMLAPSPGENLDRAPFAADPLPVPAQRRAARQHAATAPGHPAV